MIVAVLDTNVIISSLLSPKGPPAEVIEHWEKGEFEVATSPPLVAELKHALNYPRVRKHIAFSEAEIKAFLKRLKLMAKVIKPQMKLNLIEKDPSDNRVLECAVTAKAAYIVSGNSHLLELKQYKQIVILNPVGFLATLKLAGIS